MNIEKLETGLTFKNYKEMCEVLGIEVKKSVGSKNSQFKELERYCHYSKSGHKITIEKIYDEPLPKIDMRGKSEGTQKAKTKYGDKIQLLILDLLAQCQNGVITISRSKLLLSLCMININYNTCKEHPKKLSKFTQIDEKVIYDFFNTTSSGFRSNVETAIKVLKDKRIISCDTVTKVRESESYKYRLATDYEIGVIMEIEKSALKELGYERMSEVRMSKDWKAFRIKTKRLIKSRIPIDFYYTAYHIVANTKYLEEERKELISFLLEDEERKVFKDEFNASVCENLNQNAQNRHDKNKGFLTDGKLFRADEDYTKNFKELIDLLISSNAKQIAQQVMDIDDIEALSEEQLEDIDRLFA